ncbi:hypothetical protein CRD_00788 [Raphidiopsis brookii D9]|nr:hypothetical protein CRD_00788 [Raphidiopsis brookii D9]
MEEKLKELRLVRFHLGSGINGNFVDTFSLVSVTSVRFHLGSGINGNSHA